MRPVRYTNAPTITCQSANAEPGRCLEDLITTIGSALRDRFDGRGSVETDHQLHHVNVSVRDPLLSTDPEGGEYLLTASVALRVRDVSATEEDRRVAVQPRIIAEISRHKGEETWLWAVVDFDNKLGTFLREIEDVIAQTQESGS